MTTTTTLTTTVLFCIGTELQFVEELYIYINQ